MNLILLGAPGAGKGTQAEFINDHFGIPSFSTGNILREAVRNETETGKLAKSYMDSGALVPDDVILKVVSERLKQPDAQKGFILDGVPRTVVQAEALEGMIDIDLVINLTIDDEEIVQRLSGRRVCENCGTSYHTIYRPSTNPDTCDRCGGRLIIRKDDEPDTILARLKVYREQTEPLVKFYEERGKLATVRSAREVSETRRRVFEVLEALS